MKRLVTLVAEFLVPLAKQKGIDVQLDLQNAFIDGVEARLKEAVENVFSNAIRYNRVGGKIDIYLAPQEQAVLLTFHDTGMGISPEEQSQIFERFYRSDVSRNRDDCCQGAGLGLAIAKWVVEAHGGSIAVDSTVDVGTTFTLSFQASD